MDKLRRRFNQALSVGLGQNTLAAVPAFAARTSLGLVSAAGLSACMRPARNIPERLSDQARIETLASRQAEPKLFRGQAWEFQESNLYNGETRAKVLHRLERNQVGEPLIVSLLRDQNQGTDSLRREIFSEPWKLIQEAHHDSVVRFESPVALIPSQLRTGFEERYSTRYRVVTEKLVSSDQASAPPPTPIAEPFGWLRWNVYLDVQGWERLQVPAGNFDVARIRRRIYFKHPDGFRTESTRAETIWYAPSLGYWVAREWTGQYLAPGSRRRGSYLREDWVRWELTRSFGPPTG
jgi:hypothetical protein